MNALDAVQGLGALLSVCVVGSLVLMCVRPKPIRLDLKNQEKRAVQKLAA